MERDASAEQTDRQRQTEGGGLRGGLGHDIISVPYFALTLVSQQGCVVTPRTQRTLPSQNSTFVMSCRRGCYHGAD